MAARLSVHPRRYSHCDEDEPKTNRSYHN